MTTDHEAATDCKKQTLAQRFHRWLTYDPRFALKCAEDRISHLECQFLGQKAHREDAEKALWRAKDEFFDKEIALRQELVEAYQANGVIETELDAARDRIAFLEGEQYKTLCQLNERSSLIGQTAQERNEAVRKASKLESDLECLRSYCDEIKTAKHSETKIINEIYTLVKTRLRDDEESCGSCGDLMSECEC